MSSDSGTSLPDGGEQQVRDVDERHYLLQAEQEGTQKKTFTNWINSQLSKCPKPSVINDLFTDLKDGHVLLDLLELLSGEELRREKGRNVFQSRSNIESALTFLGKQSIKLINIHVEDIISGKASIVLGLIWKIILHFHIQGLAEILSNAEEQSESKNGVSPTASPPTKKSAKSRWKLSAKKALLQWAKEKCAQNGLTNVTDFKSSWKSGLAFLAIIHSLRPDLVDMDRVKERTDEENLREAFKIAEDELKIPSLLEPEDVNVADPDEKSIMTYVAQFLQYSKSAPESRKEIPVQVKKAIEWLNVENQALKDLFASMKRETYAKKYHEMLLYMRKFNEQKRVFLADISMKSLPLEEQQLIKQSLENITTQIAEWKKDLDRRLPPPLNDIESWLTDVENLSRQKLPEADNHCNTVSLLQNICTSYKALISLAANHLESIKNFKTMGDNGEILVPSDKMEELKARTLKIINSNYIVLIDYHCCGHITLALLDEAKPRLKSWTAKCKTQESVEALLADWKDFMEDRGFANHLETAFQRLQELKTLLTASDEYSNDPGILKEYESIESKYNGFLLSAQHAKSSMENVLSSWLHFENNIPLITCWLDEQQRIPPAKVPMEILSKWKSVLDSLHKDGNLLIERTSGKMASKLSNKLKTVNGRWEEFVIVLEKQKESENLSKVTLDSKGDDQTLLSPSGASLVPERHLSEEDIKHNFESSKSKLESYISTATCLLEQRLTPDEFISQHEKTLGGFSSESLENFLKFADEMKHISKPNEQKTVECVSTDIRNRWKVIHSEIESYVCHLKIQVLKKRFDDLFQKMEAQVNKEKMYKEDMDLEELIRAHKILFSEDGYHGRLSSCLQEMKELCDDPKAQRDAQTGALVAECTKKKEELEKRAAEVYLHLPSHQEQLQVLMKEPSFGTLENGTMTEICKSNGMSSLLKVSEAAVEHSNGIICEQDTSEEPPLQKITKRCNLVKSHLENLLQHTRETLDKSPRKAQDLSELQQDLQELQVLHGYIHYSWVQFEAASQELENVVDAEEKMKLLEKRNLLKCDVKVMNEEITNRTKSLDITINVLLPIEYDVNLLHDTNQFSQEQEADKFTRSYIESALKELKDVQTSLEDDIQQCDLLESSPELVDPSSPVAVQSVVHKYKVQLESITKTVGEREAVLKELENFLSSVETTKQSIDTLPMITDGKTLQEKQSKLEALEKRIYKLRQDAEKLDVLLLTVNIHLEDPETGGETSCQKMVSVMFGRIHTVQTRIRQVFGNWKHKDEPMMEASNQTLHPFAKESVSLPFEANHPLQDSEMEIFTVSDIDTVLQEMKGIQGSFEEVLLSSSEIDGKASPGVIPDEDTVHEYRMHLKSSSTNLKEREDTLKSLGIFLSSLERTKLSIEAQSVNPGMNRRTLLEIQRYLEALEKDIYSLGQEAEKLDCSLQASGILLEDPEVGGPTSCQKIISGFFERVERAQEAVTKEFHNLEETEKAKALSVRLKEFCRRIQEIHMQIDKVGLKDPTIPSVQKRMRLLVKLEKELDSCAQEKRSIGECAAQLSSTARLNELEEIEQCEHLWEDTWQSVAYSKEQCEKVHELLRRFHSCRTILTSLIQKAENTISQKSPYVGKENLQKMITQVEAVNREFKEKSESVDEINSICKNLQFHLNKMKSFEKPPFQKEATLMVDKYLDMCDKMDNYEGHLKKAYGLWNIIINLSKSLQQWSDSKMKLCEDVTLTKNEVTSLIIELQSKAKDFDDISRKTKEIQIGLQLDELPLELQVIKTSLEKKMELIHMFATRTSETSEAGSDGHTAAKLPDPDVTGEGSTPDTSMLVDEAVETNGINTMTTGGKERTGNGDPHIEHKATTMEVQIAALQNKETGRSDVSGNDKDLQEPDVSGPLENHKLKMIELRTKQELLNSNLQVGLRDKTLRLEDLQQFLKETQGLADFLIAQDPEKAIPGPGVDSDELPKIKHDYNCLLGQIQDTMQMLERRVQSHRLYESLCAALNSEMTSFSEELLNFTGSSLETTACEETRHKLQELREQFEGMERRVKEISSIAESMKLGTPSPSHTDIDETLKLYHGKMGDFMTKLKSLEDEDKGLSHVPGKRIIRKAKKVKQLPPEHMVLHAQEESAKDKKATKTRKKKKVVAESSSEEKVKLDDQPVKETAIPVNLANTMDYKAQVVSVPSSGDELKVQDQSIQEVIVPVNQEDTMDRHVQVLPESQCGSAGSDIDRSQENIPNLLEWLHNARIKLQILKETSCEEHQLKEKLNAVENMCCEITQKKIDLDVTDVTGETVEEKLLQGATDVGKEQEAIGQVENLLHDCDWYRRQLETSLNDLTAVNQDVHRTSCLLSSLEERLCGRKVLLNDVDKADILKDVQPLYEDVKAYIVSVERAVTQAAGLNISLKAKEDIAMITETYERVTNKMISLSSSNGDMVTKGEHTSDGEQIETQEDPDLSFKAPDFLLVEDVDAYALHEKDPTTSSEFLEPGDDDGSSGELQIQLLKHQQDLDEILRCIQGLLQTDFPDKQPRSTETKLQRLLNQIKCWYIGEHVKDPPEEKPGMLTKEGIEQKLCRWKKLPLDLDGTVTELLIHDIENVYEEMTKLEFPESFLNNGTSSFQRTGDAEGGPSFEHFKSWRVALLFELETLKTQKLNERQAIKDYQNALRTSKSSLKRLNKEMENLKMGPSEIHTDHLDKILNFLNKLSKETGTLHTLKAEQAKICSCGLSHLDIKKVEMDVEQIEESWEQTELMVEKKRVDLAKTAEELGFLKQKVDHVQHMVKELSLLLDQPPAPPQEPVKASLFLAADLQAAKHSFSSLRNVFDLQMKRSWGQSECRSLENSLDDLQSQLENVERRASEVQRTTLQSSDIILENHAFLKPLYEALLWVKKSSSRAVFEHTIALLPEDVAEQILDCKSLQNEIIGRKSTVVSIIENSKQVRSSEGVVSSEEFNSFSQQLQDLYEEQIIQSDKRLRDLECGRERRTTLFSEIEKLEEQLRSVERGSAAAKRGTFTAEESDQQLNRLKAQTIELGEIEGLASKLLKDSQNYHHELKICEQMYLNDILRSLKSKTSRLLKEQNRKLSHFEKIKSIYNEFQERISRLTQDQKALRDSKPERGSERMRSTEEDFENKLQGAQNPISLPSDHWFQIQSYQELFQDVGLYWDNSAVENLPECTKNTAASHETGQQVGSSLAHHRKLLENIQLMMSSVRNDFAALGGHFNPIHLGVICRKIKKIIFLIKDNLPPGQPVVNTEEQKLRELGEKLDLLQQSLTQLMAISRAKEPNKENILRRLRKTLADLKGTELQQPFIAELDINKLQMDLLRLEAIEEICKSDLQDLKYIVELEKSLGNGEQFHGLNELEKELEKSISQHIETLNLSCKTLQKFQEVIARVTECFVQNSNVLQYPVDLETLQDGSEGLVLLTNKKDLDVGVDEVHKVMEDLRPHCKPEVRDELDNIMCAINNNYSTLSELYERNQTVLTSCGEKYELYKQIKRKMKNELEGMVAVLRDLISQLPMSYKAAWMQWEKSKDLVAKMYSYEEDLLKFKQVSRDLNSSVKEDSSILIDKSVMTLWDKWIYWLGVARDWELYCEDLKQEWKSVSEEIEREIILLDHFQEEAPDRIGRDQNTNQLLDLSLELKRFVGNVKMQQLHLSLLMGRIKNILSTSEGCMEMESIPITKEILSMKKKCKTFQEKAKKTDEDVQKELQDRDLLKEEMSAVKKSIQKVSTGLEDLLLHDPEDKKEQLEELQKIIELEKEKANKLMEKLKIQYSGRVPADLSLLQEECQTYLEETEDKVKNEVLQGCPMYVMARKVEEVTTSLQRIETQLTNKSENIIKAKEFQQNIWDALDVCHSKLIALESEVQDLAEEDPSQAQEWMDKLMDPLKQYQQVSYLVERRSANLNKAASKLEEYEEIIKGITSWLQNTNNLLNQEMKDCSAKVLSKHSIALEIALDDLGQKHSILEAIRSELGELALIFETDNITEQLDEISRQVRDLLQRLMNILPHFQHVTNEVLFIEAEVKRIERNADTIKTILTSNDIVDMSPREHYKNGEVILENIASMKKTIAEIEDYKPDLSLAESGIQSLCVFRRTGQILKELAMYENATKQQNELLEPIISEMMELEQEQEKLRHLSKSMAHETADMKEKTEKVKERLEGLNQKKEVVIESSRSSVTEEIERLQLESLEVESAAAAAPVTEEKALFVNEEPNTQAWLDSYYLPSLAEETEEDSFGTEAEDKASIAGERVILPEPRGESSSYSPTVISDGSLQGEPGKTLADVKSEPEMILNDCQGRVTEVELWLENVNLSLALSEQDPEMHQTVEQQLADWQNTVEDIEKKVCALLESNLYINKGKGALLKEAESLSLKLKALKTSLENVQAMLQVKSTDEKLSNEVPASSTTKDWLKQIDQEVNGEAHSKTIVSETKLGESEPTDVSLGVRHLRSREEVLAVDNDYASQAATEDVSSGKWQYLQRDLSYRMKNMNVPTVTKDVKIHVLPRFPVSAIKMAATEEPKNLTLQLDALTEEVSIPRTTVKAGDQQRTLFLWLCSVSQWLQDVEDMLDVEVLSKEEATRQLAHCKKLSDDLHMLSTVMENRKETLLGSRGDALTAVLPQCYDSVRNWLVKTRSTADLRAKSIQTELEKNNNYQNDIRQLYGNLLKKKDDLVQHFNNAGSQDLTKRLQDAANYETELCWYENQLSLLEKQRGGLHVPLDLYQDVHRSEDVLNDVWKFLRKKQEEFAYVLADQSQLDALQCALVDLSAIGKEKVSLSKDHRSISKNSLAFNVHNYKEFFRIFSSHVLLLETYSLKFSELVTGKEQREHVLHDATLLQGDAETCCVHMMTVLKNWQEFDSRYEGLRKELDALMSAVPSIGLVEETEEKVTGRLAQYQQIKGRIDAFEPRLCQIVLEGKKLLTAVNCQELESQITTVEQNWSQLTKKVNHELHRLESLGRHLASYIKDSADLSLWLEWANQKLQIWKMLSLDASQDLETTRSNLTDFLEFTNDVDQKSSLKTSVLNTGSQLLRVKEGDSTLLKVNLEKFEEKWTNLIAALPAVQEKLQQLLMEKLPSWEAMHEVMSWMDQAECEREPENDTKLPTTLSDVKSCLQECKDFKKRMTQKQWLVDYVNQSLLQLSVGDVEIKRYERNGFAERLGAMNLQWRQMQGDVGSKIQRLEQILETFAEDDSRRQILSNWFDGQQQQLEKLRYPTSIPAAENVLADCVALEEQLLTKTASIEDLKRGFEVTDGTEHAPSEEETITQALLTKRDCVLNQVAKLKSSMLTVLKKWKGFEENLDKANRTTIKIQYLLQQCQPPAPSLRSLQSQLKRLKLMQEEVEEWEEKWAKLNISLNNLRALCGPSVHSILHEKYEESTARWSAANQDLSARIQSASSLLQLWEDYAAFYSAYSTSLGELEEKCDRLMYGIISEDNAAHSLQQRLQDLHDLKQSIQELKAKAEQVSELGEQVLRQEPAAVDVVLSERDTASQRMAHLERNIYSRTAELTGTMSEVDSFKRDLETLDSRVKASAGIIDQIHLPGREKERNSAVIKEHLLQLSEDSTDVKRLNEESFSIPLADHTLKTLQNLNRTWSKAEATALEDCRLQRMDELEKNNFVQNYETWIQWLEKMEDGLNVGTAGNHQALKTQQQIYKRLQAEIAINEHILPSFVTKALNMLEKEAEDNRSEFISRLTALKEKWHGVVKLVQEREAGVTALLKRWWTFSKSKQRLEKHLAGIQNALTSVEGEKCHSLFHTKKLMYYFMDKQQQLRRCQSSYLSTVDACNDLQAIADPETKKTLESDLHLLEVQWESVSHRLGATIARLHANDVKRQGFQGDIQDRRKILHELKARADKPLPTLHEELMKAREPIKELEEALDEWNQSLKELDNMKAELSEYIVAEDGMFLRKQVEALHKQWEELCLRVSARRQEIEDRLSAWTIFNDKNKEFCDWLTQMENKALQAADVNTEEMIEKLQKDFMEEINLFSENKNHLKQIGDQLIIASNKVRAAEIDNKLQKISDRWQHLFDVTGSRVKRLKETLVVIQQLEKKMSNLRTWLAQIESELSKPVIYSICNDQEIHRKLTEQQDIQKDIELHSTGVASVLNICERLLHDTDSCPNETERDSIQQTTRSLDKRWRNICTMSMERRLRIEETWRLWQKFLEDYTRFEEWLQEAEAMAAAPDSSDVLYTKAKEEQKRFEAFQRQIHERLTHLELINKQYRRLARENRTDAASKLKLMVHDGNQRWDQLQKRVSSILRRLKHFTSQREEFEGSRDNILVWLTEIDLQLTNVEHFSESDIDDKMQRLAEFQQEITLKADKVDQLIDLGEQLIQKSEAFDAVNIEDELEELNRYYQEVFGRVSRFHQRLTNRDRQLEEERETSENDTDAEDSRELQNSSWHSTMHDVNMSHQSICHLIPPTLSHERSGRETPVSVDSIPLEWDPTVDVGGSSMHENEDEGTYYNALSDVEITENPEAYVIMTTKTVQASSVTDLNAATWHSDKNGSTRRHEYEHGIMKGLLSAKAETNVPSALEKSTSTEDQEPQTSSTSDQQAEDPGLFGFESPETHSGVIERWEIFQARSLSNELRAKQNQQRWQQLTSDLRNITLWLDTTESDLHGVRELTPVSTLQELEQKARRLKDILRSFDNYKALVISANLSSKEFQQEEDSASRDALSRLHDVNTRWDQACRSRDEWRESLQSELIDCKEFHNTCDQLVLWLTEAEARRVKFRVADQCTDPQILLESQKQLMQLKEQLLERQMKVNALRDLAACLLVKTSGDVYFEVEEKAHVIGNKANQLMKDISDDLKSVQEALDNSASSDVVDTATTIPSKSQAVGTVSQDSDRSKVHAVPARQVAKKPSFFYRVLRAAFPLQLFLLLLLLLACMIPFSEDDFSCTQANNFARSFYPMLRYMNGPPPT